MMEAYFAHIAEDGRKQTVLEHLEGTAELCARFARAFGAEEQGRLVGMAHDLGKTSKEFQARLQGGPIVDHATAGAVECAKWDFLWAAHCVAGHHGGLLDEGSLMDQAGDATLLGRLKKGVAGQIPAYRQDIPLEAVPQPASWGKEPLTDAFFIRMLYSCLVDADYLDTEQFMKGENRERGHYDPLPVLLDRLEQYIAPLVGAENRAEPQAMRHPPGVPGERERTQRTVYPDGPDRGREDRGLPGLCAAPRCPAGDGARDLCDPLHLHH